MYVLCCSDLTRVDVALFMEHAAASGSYSVFGRELSYLA